MAAFTAASYAALIVQKLVWFIARAVTGPTEEIDPAVLADA